MNQVDALSSPSPRHFIKHPPRSQALPKSMAVRSPLSAESSPPTSEPLSAALPTVFHQVRIRCRPPLRRLHRLLSAPPPLHWSPPSPFPLFPPTLLHSAERPPPGPAAPRPCSYPRLPRPQVAYSQAHFLLRLLLSALRRPLRGCIFEQEPIIGLEPSRLRARTVPTLERCDFHLQANG